MSNYYFSDPDKLTFKAIKFNGQIFARGRGLYIHLKKYFPSTLDSVMEDSKSIAEDTPENFSRATHGMKSHFRGIRFHYIDVDKKFRDEIKELSSCGEGWWPERKKPTWTTDQNLGDFMLKYEAPPHYIRRLGKGMNLTTEERNKIEDGVDFTPKGFADMLEVYQTVSGERVGRRTLPQPMFNYWFLPAAAVRMRNLNRLENSDWRVWQMLRKRREEYFNNVKYI